MREYVRTISDFFRSGDVFAIALLTDREYDAVAAEATRAYYDEIHVFPVVQLSLYERMELANR